jgi:hypothetical protein
MSMDKRLEYYLARRPLSLRAKQWRKEHPEIIQGNRAILATYWGIMYRCYKPTYKSYRWYGGRGIKVCREWRKSYPAFKTWALANGWQKGMHIDRHRNDRNYCPSNCQILTAEEHNHKSFGQRQRKRINKLRKQARA